METFKLLIATTLFVGISAMCSGLNLAFMSLGIADLKRQSKAGDSNAKKLLPLRTNAHLSLASILLTNVAAVSATSLTLGSRFGGLIAGIASTLLLVLFAEILPQALFVKNALKVSGFLTPAIKLMIFIFYPISKPLQLVLDSLFGKEQTKLHTRLELGIIIAEHSQLKGSELDEDEVEIIKGALQLSEKRVKSIMTPIKKAYWVTPETMLDAQKIDEIKEESWSRIPVLSKDLKTCHGILLMKELIDIDFDDEPRQVSEMPIHPTKIVGGNTALDTMFRKFIGAHTHMMAIELSDKIVGIITIEDLIEEILGHEIEDETDH